jgi:hypothetical protein
VCVCARAHLRVCVCVCVKGLPKEKRLEMLVDPDLPVLLFYKLIRYIIPICPPFACTTDFVM